MGMSSEQVIKIKNNDGEILKYELLNTCEFTSTRKRQSSIIRNK
jgi:magnesium-transporting ATPase (P-type)